MSAPLPRQASLRRLEIRARDLRRAHRVTEPQARRRVSERHPRYHRAADAPRAGAALCLQDVQLVIARECGSESWPRLTAALAAGPESATARAGWAGTSAAAAALNSRIGRAVFAD